MGKYGEEGDKLLFKILNSGDFAQKVSDDIWEEKNSLKLATKISEKGLRYDLTVPFARFVVQHQNEIQFPFKRYQIQPVWRADRPQKGRYREFFQCDVDVVGSNSPLNEVEIIQIVNDVYESLQLDVSLKINNRKILAGLAQTIGHEEQLIDITVAIDKLDKMGIDKVIEELAEKGISKQALQTLRPIIEHKGNYQEKIILLEEILKDSEIGMKGIEEIKTIFEYTKIFDLSIKLELDISLARGLNYYTGAIFEVVSNEVQIGSITGGGRYDNLTGIFGLKDVSGVGISFGADRIYDVLLQTNKFPQFDKDTTRVLFINFGEKESLYVLPLISKIRKKDINAELYPHTAKLKKQFSYANNKSIPFVAIVGEEEIKTQTIQLKNMETGEQKQVDLQTLINILK